jgi:hypothetical protein
MPGTFNAATGFPIVLLVFFIIPAIWIIGVIRIGSHPRRLGLWTLPFLLLYAGLVVAVRVFGWLA